MSGNEEVDVRKVISDFADAWNRHDAKAMAELHTDDVNFVNIFGQWWKGQGEVEEGLRRGHATAFSKSRMLVNSEMVKFPATNVALVHGTMELQDAPPETLGRCHSSRVLSTKTAGGSSAASKTHASARETQRHSRNRACCTRIQSPGFDQLG